MGSVRALPGLAPARQTHTAGAGEVTQHQPAGTVLGLTIQPLGLLRWMQRMRQRTESLTTTARRINRAWHLTLTPAATAALKGVAPRKVSRYISHLIEVDAQGRARELADYSHAEIIAEMHRRFGDA